MSAAPTPEEVVVVAARLAALEERLQTRLDDYNESLDTIWMLITLSLVFFMHSGFSFLEAGSVREKNTQNILAKNMIVATVGFLAWWFLGWLIAFGAGDNPNKFAGSENFVMIDFWNDKTLFRKWLFQGTFCATGGTIVSGSMAERTQLKGFLLYTIFMTSVIYPIVVWWGWSGHGMFAYGDGESVVGPALKDFSGSGMVHMVGGIGAICGAIIVEPRAGRWDGDKQADFDGHNVPYCVMGTLFLWFGWYGFNPGSTLQMHSVDSAYVAGIVAVNTTLAPCVSGLALFALRALVVGPKKLDVGGFCNGILAGLVSVTAPCAWVKPWEAIIIGFIGALAYQGVSMLVKALRVDDVVDAFAVHGACGFWGIVATGFFGDPEEGMGGNGVFYKGNQLGIQLFTAFLIVVWVGSLTVAFMLPLKKFGWLRHSDDFQDAGADAEEHSPRKAYSTPSFDLEDKKKVAWASVVVVAPLKTGQ